MRVLRQQFYCLLLSLKTDFCIKATLAGNATTYGSGKSRENPTAVKKKKQQKKPSSYTLWWGQQFLGAWLWWQYSTAIMQYEHWWWGDTVSCKPLSW